MKLLSLFCFSFYILTACSQVKKQDSSQYNNHYINPDSLSWNDYTGKCNYFQNYTAYTSSVIKLTFKRNKDSVDYIKIWVVFLNDSSYVKREILSLMTTDQNNDLFIHERNHYLINIMYAKGLKKFVMDNPRMTDTAIRNILINSMYHAQEMQIKYDSETNHSMDKIGQIKWNSFISNTLSLYSGYELIEDKSIIFHAPQ